MSAIFPKSRILLKGRRISNKFNVFKEKYKDCQQCPLHKTRNRIVLCRGTLPCDILFIGEGPGGNEDSLGFPFMGRAGEFLQGILNSVFHPHPDLKKNINTTYAITNIVCCRPPENRNPEIEEIEACRQRLIDFIQLAKPKWIIQVGKVAKENFPPNLPKLGGTLHIRHPSWAMRQRAGDRAAYIRTTQNSLRKIISTIEGSK